MNAQAIDFSPAERKNGGMLKLDHRRIISWVAIAAVLFAALAPTLSHVFPVKNMPQTLWQKLCTAQGTKLLASNTQNEPLQDSAPGKVGMHFEHCPYCFTHAGSVGLVFDNNPVIAKTAFSFHFPRLFYQSPYPLFAWVSSSPRAPPVRFLS